MRKFGWGLAEFMQSIGAHLLIQYLIPAEPRGKSCSASIPLSSSQPPFVVVKTQTETAVTYANKQPANDLTRILLDISSDQFEAVSRAHYQ